jgi:hypothetical protein
MEGKLEELLITSTEAEEVGVSSNNKQQQGLD